MLITMELQVQFLVSRDWQITFHGIECDATGGRFSWRAYHVYVYVYVASWRPQRYWLWLLSYWRARFSLLWFCVLFCGTRACRLPVTAWFERSIRCRWQSIAYDTQKVRPPTKVHNSDSDVDQLTTIRCSLNVYLIRVHCNMPDCRFPIIIFAERVTVMSI